MDRFGELTRVSLHWKSRGSIPFPALLIVRFYFHKGANHMNISGSGVCPIVTVN